MASQLLSLRHVPEDELDEIRQLLQQRHIEFYETPVSHWGISGGGIWLVDDEDIALAKRYLATYQAERQQRMHAKYATLKAQNQHPTLWRTLKAHPVRVTAFLGLAAAVLYVSAVPFLHLK